MRECHWRCDGSLHNRRGEEVWRGSLGVVNGGDTDLKVRFTSTSESDSSSPPPSSPLQQRCALRPVVLPPDCGASSGFLLLREVEDLAVGLSQVLLLFEVHLKRPLDGHEGDASLRGKHSVNRTLKHTHTTLFPTSRLKHFFFHFHAACHTYASSYHPIQNGSCFLPSYKCGIL